MRKNYTPETLLLYLYKELDANEIAEIRKALKTDFHLAHEYEQLCESMHLLDDVEMQPSDSSIEIIMEHSLSAEETTT
jgi:hypothetical protein